VVETEKEGRKIGRHLPLNLRTKDGFLSHPSVHGLGGRHETLSSMQPVKWATGRVGGTHVTPSNRSRGRVTKLVTPMRLIMRVVRSRVKVRIFWQVAMQ
jgi:hypothetical protein